MLEALMTVLGFFLTPWSEFLYNIKAIQKLYLVKHRKTEKESEFRSSKAPKYAKKKDKVQQKLTSEEDKQKALEL